MKLKLFLAAALLALGLASCEKDGPENYAQTVAGSYKGWTSAEFQYSPDPMLTANETLSLLADEEINRVKLSFVSSSLGTFTCEASVSPAGSGYAITGSGTTVMGMDPDNRKEYAVTVTGTVSLSGTSRIVFAVPSVMGGLTITFTEGEMPAES